ncbi:MAG: universal stress protein [Balneolaceae bacterium]|nr:MAG: universal stress protein [Balneolaceae bacterium]
MSSKEIKHILFPTDFSVCSSKALDVAMEIADKTGATISILYVIEPVFEFAAEAETEDIHEFMDKTAKENFKKMKSDREKSRFKNLKVSTSIKDGNVITSVLREAKEKGADFIVMGSIGATGFKKVLFGSTALEVMRQSPVPVLVVPDSDKKPDFKNFLFTTNFRERDPQNLAFSKNIADKFNAKLTVLHIVKTIDFKSEVLRRGFIDYMGDTIKLNKLTFVLYEHEDIPEGISSFIQEKPVSVIIMNRYQKSVLNVILGRDKTQSVISYDQKPLLIIP